MAYKYKYNTRTCMYCETELPNDSFELACQSCRKERTTLTTAITSVGYCRFCRNPMPENPTLEEVAEQAHLDCYSQVDTFQTELANSQKVKIELKRYKLFVNDLSFIISKLQEMSVILYDMRVINLSPYYHQDFTNLVTASLIEWQFLKKEIEKLNPLLGETTKVYNHGYADQKQIAGCQAIHSFIQYHAMIYGNQWQPKYPYYTINALYTNMLEFKIHFHKYISMVIT